MLKVFGVPTMYRTHVQLWYVWLKEGPQARIKECHTVSPKVSCCIHLWNTIKQNSFFFFCLCVSQLTNKDSCDTYGALESRNLNFFTVFMHLHVTCVDSVDVLNAGMNFQLKRSATKLFFRFHLMNFLVKN